MAGTFVACMYPMGEMMVGLVQWLTLDWRFLLRILRIPFLAVAIFFWTMPESVRWLVANGKLTQAVDVLKKIARYNGTVVTKETEELVMKHGINEKVRIIVCILCPRLGEE